jgi:ribosomal protein L7/L12
MNKPARSAAELAAPVLDALNRGNVIEAFKLMRAASGLGLREAKQALDAYQRGKQPSAAQPEFPRALPGGSLPPSVVEALQRGNKIEAVTRLRQQTGLGLKEAKDAVELFRQLHPRPDDPSPGEVRDSGGALVWVAVALAVVFLLAYRIFQRLG